MPISHDDPRYASGVALKRLPLRKAALLYIAVVCLCLFGLLYLQLEQSRRHDLAMAQVDSANLTRAMAQQAEDTFMKADLVLTSLADWIQEDGFSASQLPRLRQIFTRRAQTLKQLHGIFLFDREGRRVVSSFVDRPTEANALDREYFLFHQQNVSTVAHIGPAIRSRENGDWIIPLSKRVNDNDGNFQGVLLAGIKMSYFDQFFKSFSIDEDGSMFLALSDGTLLARRPFVESQIGQSLASSEIFSTYLAGATSGNAMISSVLDGTVRLAGFRQLDAYPLVVSASSSRDSILKGWYATAFQSSFIVALVVFGVGLVGWVFVRQVRLGERVEADLRQTKEALKLIATHDSLTGLANRRLFEQALDTEFTRCIRQPNALSLIMLDIDYFKRYNDAYGHVAGDHCLAQVAQIVKNCCVRKADLAVRYGGEEFAVLLPDTDIHGALLIAEQIRHSVIGRSISHSDSPMGCVTVSLGCYSFVPTRLDSTEAFIERADAALYRAKHSGRNRSAVLSMENTVED